MRKRPALQENGTAGELLSTAARDILSEARAALADEPEAAAVHEFRKAMKRWRALLRLLEPFLGAAGRRLRLEARDLARELSRPRDAQAALDGLADILKRDDRLPQRTVEAIRGRLEATRQSAENAILTEATRSRIDAALAEAARAIDQWPVRTVGATDIIERLTRTYRRARHTIPDDWQEASAENLHELRRRVIEFRYQAEFLQPLWPRLAKAWMGEAQRLRDRLGRYQDLVVLTSRMGAGEPLASWHAQLAPWIRKRQAAHLRAAERLTDRLLAERPKEFRRQLQAACKRRFRSPARARKDGQED